MFQGFFLYFNKKSVLLIFDIKNQNQGDKKKGLTEHLICCIESVEKMSGFTPTSYYNDYRMSKRLFSFRQADFIGFCIIKFQKI